VTSWFLSLWPILLNDCIFFIFLKYHPNSSTLMSPLVVVISHILLPHSLSLSNALIHEWKKIKYKKLLQLLHSICPGFDSSDLNGPGFDREPKRNEQCCLHLGQNSTAHLPHKRWSSGMPCCLIYTSSSVFPYVIVTFWCFVCSFHFCAAKF